MYRISSMQVPDQEFFLPQITLPQKASSSKKFLKDQSEDSQTSQVDQISNQTQRQIDTKQQPNDSTTNVQGDIKNIKRQQQKQKKQKRKKKNKNKKQMSSVNKQQKKDKFNCRFYIQGSCKNGTKCKFIHPVDFPSTIPQPTKPKQPKLQPYPKKQSSSQLKQQPQSPIKFSRDVYFERMINTMKQSCYSCKKREILVTLSCGCQTICEFCVRSKNACSKENHFYDDKVYIK